MHAGIVIAMALTAFACQAEAPVSTQRLGDFVWSNAQTDEFLLERIELKGIRPGARAEMTMWVDASGLTNGTPEASLAWDDNQGGSWVGGSGGTVERWDDPKIEKDANGRRRFRLRTGIVPSDVGRSFLYFFAKKPAQGTIVYTDIVLSIFPRSYDSSMASTAYRGCLSNDSAKFRVSYITDPDAEPVDSLLGEFVFTGSRGTEVRKRARLLTGDFAEVTISGEDLNPGQQNVRFVMSQNGRQLFEASTAVTRVEGFRKRHVMFDRFGRTLIDGKPFFPLGMYWSENTLEKPGALERYANGPFNCLQTYERAMTPGILDRYWQHGLRVVASVKDAYAPDENGEDIVSTPVGLKTIDEEVRYVREVVGRCKDHPALLAWYTCDEMAEKYTDRLKGRYELMREIDPDHPAFICLCHPDSARTFVNACDVVGSDPYPVAGTSSSAANREPDKGEVWKAGESAARIRRGMYGCRAQWQVPQAFAWKWQYTESPELRFPTLNELKSMVWQQIAAGANGILLYSYGQLCNWEKDDFDGCWDICRMTGQEVRDQMDVLLKRPGPDLVAPARTRVRTWYDTHAMYVLICNTHPVANAGSISLPLAFDGQESLLGPGAVLSGQMLNFDLPPIGTCLIKLKKKERMNK